MEKPFQVLLDILQQQNFASIGKPEHAEETFIFVSTGIVVLCPVTYLEVLATAD